MAACSRLGRPQQVTFESRARVEALETAVKLRLMLREVITVKRVTFKDESSWEPGMPFLRGYENDGPKPTS
jgi:hypothetical protein